MCACKPLPHPALLPSLFCSSPAQTPRQQAASAGWLAYVHMCAGLCVAGLLCQPAGEAVVWFRMCVSSPPSVWLGHIAGSFFDGRCK